ncbi:unnamed protein product [Pedinophyceae sp. YPF-701]|nr:unnamed protein product [Pedinophyceae sp. YPF-701]
MSFCSVCPSAAALCSARPAVPSRCRHAVARVYPERCSDARSAPDDHAAAVSRRAVLAIAAAAPCLLRPRSALAGEEQDEDEYEYVEVEEIGGTPTPDSKVLDIDGEQFVSLEWAAIVPNGFKEAPIPTRKNTIGQRASGLFDTNPNAAKENSPVKAVWVLEGRPDVSLSVVQQTASSIKPTFTQLTDISQWGSLEDAARIVLPRGSRLVSSKVIALDLGEKDTGTVRGKVKQDLRNVYRYEFVASNGRRVAMAVAALRGEVFFFNSFGDDAAWKDKATRRKLRGAADNFRVLDKPMF